MTKRTTHQARRAKLAEKLRTLRQDNSGGQGETSSGPDAALRRSGGAANPGGEIKSEGDDAAD